MTKDLELRIDKRGKEYYKIQSLSSYDSYQNKSIHHGTVVLGKITEETKKLKIYEYSPAKERFQKDTKVFLGMGKQGILRFKGKDPKRFGYINNPFDSYPESIQNKINKLLFIWLEKEYPEYLKNYPKRIRNKSLGNNILGLRFPQWLKYSWKNYVYPFSKVYLNKLDKNWTKEQLFSNYTGFTKEEDLEQINNLCEVQKSLYPIWCLSLLKRQFTSDESKDYLKSFHEWNNPKNQFCTTYNLSFLSCGKNKIKQLIENTINQNVFLSQEDKKYAKINNCKLDDVSIEDIVKYSKIKNAKTLDEVGYSHNYTVEFPTKG